MRRKQSPIENPIAPLRMWHVVMHGTKERPYFEAYRFFGIF